MESLTSGRSLSLIVHYAFLFLMLTVCWREVKTGATSRSEEIKMGAGRATQLLNGLSRMFHNFKWVRQSSQEAAEAAGFEERGTVTVVTEDQWHNIVEVLTRLSDVDFLQFEHVLCNRIHELGNKNELFDLPMLVGMFQISYTQLKYNKADERNATMFEPGNKAILSSILERWLHEMLDLMPSLHQMLHCGGKRNKNEVFFLLDKTQSDFITQILICNL